MAAANTHGAYASFDMQTSAAQTTFGFRLTFTQGFLAGQLSVVMIALLAIRFIIFEDARTSKQQRTRRPSTLPLRTSKRSKSSTNQAAAALGTGKDTSDANVDVARIMTDILAKVDYALDTHVGESIDWVNVILAQALAGYRQDIAVGGWSNESDHAEADKILRTAKEWMEEILNANTVGRGMAFLDPIQVTNVDFGDSYPVLSNAKVRPADDMGRVRIEVDVDYTDCISLAIDTKLLINLPRPRFAVLPISLGLSIERFSGTMAIELFSTSPSPPPRSSLQQQQQQPRSRHELRFSLHPDFALDASATSLVGSRAKLQDLPKIEQLLVGRVRSFIHDRFVWPKYWTLTLPNLVPRHATKRAETEEKNDESLVNAANYAARGAAVRSHEEEQNGLFFEKAPPLFPGMFSSSSSNPQPDHSSLPGTLPTVEAWRSHAAAHGSNAMAVSDVGAKSAKGGFSASSYGPKRAQSTIDQGQQDLRYRTRSVGQHVG